MSSSSSFVREETFADGRLVKRVIQEGTGECPPNGSDVTVHYTGRLTDGAVFDSSVDRMEPFRFKLGEGRVIKGWDVGVASMKIGEKSLLVCQPEFAYGSAGSPPKIPPNSVLEFEVELLSFTDQQPVEGSNGCVLKKVKRSGTGYSQPGDSSSVSIKVKGRVLPSGPIFIDSNGNEIKRTVGEDPEAPEGLELAIKSMKQGEHSTFTVTPNYAFGSQGSSALGIPGNSQIEYEIELLNFEKSPETWEMNFDQKLDYIGKQKELGNKFFKANKLAQANERYSKVVETFQYEKDLSGEQLKRLNAIRIPALTNQAIVYYKEHRWQQVLDKSNEALKLDPTNVKCLFKRGQALAASDQFDAAMKDFKAALETDKANIEIQKEMAALQKKIKAQKEKEKKAFGGWFNKVELVSAEELKQTKQSEKEEESDEEFAEEAKPSPAPDRGDQVANPPLPVEKGAQEGVQEQTEPKSEDAQDAEMKQ
jgi:FK506-binding protein 4/5